MDNVKLVEIDHVREKLIELLDKVQDSGVIDIPAGFGFTYGWIKNEKVADHLIANGVTLDKDESKISSKWIPVTERLPERMKDVLVIRMHGDPDIEFLFYDGTWVGDTEGKKDVTHWMPLPEPPKEA